MKTRVVREQEKSTDFTDCMFHVLLYLNKSWKASSGAVVVGMGQGPVQNTTSKISQVVRDEEATHMYKDDHISISGLKVSGLIKVFPLTPNQKFSISSLSDQCPCLNSSHPEKLGIWSAFQLTS